MSITCTNRYIEQRELLPRIMTHLIIGTFPSVLIMEQKGTLDEERDVDFFYGSHYNRFWPVIERIAGIDLKRGWHNADAVARRKSLFTSCHLGITDTIYRCTSLRGTTADTDLTAITLNPYLIDILNDHPELSTLFFTSSGGPISAEKLTLKLLRERKLISDVRYISLKPRIREFQFKSRLMRSITLHSPSPSAARAGITIEKVTAQYRRYLPVPKKI